MRLRSRMAIQLARVARIGSGPVARCWATTCCVVAVTAASAQADTVYRLRPQTSISADVVRLADIVDVSMGGNGPATSLPPVALWHAPPACQPITVKAADVAARLRQLKVASFDRADFSGEVRIETGCQRLDRTGLVAVAMQALDDWLRVRGDRFDRTTREVPGTIELPPGRVSLSTRPIAPGLAASARMHVWVDVAVDGRFVRAVPLVFDVHVFRDAWLAARDLRSGRTPTDTDFLRREIDVAASPVEPVRTLRDNMRLRKPLLAGEALTASHMEPRPQVAQGSTVVVMSRAGAFAVEARAEALQDGGVGQPVWVRVAASTGPVLARVVAENVVELTRE